TPPLPAPKKIPAPPQPITTISAAIGRIAVPPQEQAAGLKKCEEIIRQGFLSFVEVGRALAQIRRAELYRIAEYPSFESYCRARWGLSRQYACDLTVAAQVCMHIAARPELPQPDPESQVRPLVGLNVPAIPLAWEAAVMNSCGQPITARTVRNAMRQL